MSRRLRIYYMAVLGALGGLLSWWVIGAGERWLERLGGLPAVGAGLGLCMGACLAVTDGALAKRVAGRALRDGLAGALAGALFGLAGLLLAERGFLALGGGFGGRALAWMLLGGLIGAADLLVSRRPRRALYGALGGMAGGVLGGLLYEALTQLFRAQSDRVQLVVGGIGLMLLGACLGALIPLARQIFARGELRVLTGEQAGLAVEVTDLATLGRYDGCEVYLPDPGVAWRHALVRRAEGGFALDVLADAGRAARVDGREIAPGQSLALHGGERIVLGETVVTFVLCANMS
jgi:hypothetical protein